VPIEADDGVEKMGLEEAWSVFREGKAVFVDARSEEDYQAGHVPGALLLNQDLFEANVSSLMDLVPPDTLIVTYCSGEGCGSSREVADLLLGAGFTNVKVFYGGWEIWKRAGYPAEKGSFLKQGMSRSPATGLL
jgi:rhodanese-related sulfurtransferase